MFRNRLRKNLRRLVPWAKQSRLEAYRIYDSDIPEVRLTVERYGASLVVWEYARRAEQEEEEHPELAAAHERFLSEVLDSLAAECAVPAGEIFFKRRQRQRRQAQRPLPTPTKTAAAPTRRDIKQYERLGSEREERLIHEGGCRFIVNLSDYVDTGLFLDHRNARALIGKLSPGKRLLNLFGYTGSFSVYAAAGGATSSLTVDLSPTYLEWASRNFAENGMAPHRHELLRADVLSFLADPGREAGSFDLIVLDPPTFSNSKKMSGTLDVERDHPWLIDRALRLLGPGGTLLFSSNHRRFTLREGEIATLSQEDGPGATLRDVTMDTLPRDFHNPRTRCCYLVSRSGRST